ncbi:MAG: imidazoleglycerol-phosphate dehydratase HisB, partial [Aldersonia sp.]|nr:imidazoleglycerol-phosphate dehydratase HisB [Aldersonia sp.]
GAGQCDVSTGVGFYDHMLAQVARHGGFDLSVRAEGDLHVDVHHTVEDTAIVFGQALGQALGDKAGIRRFGDAYVPMDETLVHAAVDVSGRPYCVHTGEPEHMLHAIIPGRATRDGVASGAPYSTVINRHVFESIALNARIALHVRVLYGRDQHHVSEAEYKAVARALRAAVEGDPRVSGVPSTKGAL